MADQCNQTHKNGWKGLVKPCIFAAKVQEEGQKQPNEMGDLVENINERVVNETPQDEQENPEVVVEDLENVKDEQFDYYEDNFKVEDDDELVAFYGAMYHDEESSQDKKVI